MLMMSLISLDNECSEEGGNVTLQIKKDRTVQLLQDLVPTPMEPPRVYGLILEL